MHIVPTVVAIGWWMLCGQTASAERLTDAPQWIMPCREVERDPAPYWVWIAAEGLPPPTTQSAAVGKVYLSRTFDAPADAEKLDARLTVAADNRAAVYLNGREVLHSESWSVPAHAKVSLRPGRNVLAVAAENEEGGDVNPAGVVAVLEVNATDGGIARAEARGSGAPGDTGGSPVPQEAEARGSGAPGDTGGSPVPQTVEESGSEGSEHGLRIVSDTVWRGATVAWEGWPAAPAPALTRHVAVLGPVDTAPWGLSIAALSPLRPCPIVRGRCTVEDWPVQGTVRVIGLGHYELYLNGGRVGETLINQAWSQYDKTLYWQDFDISTLLRPGENVLGAMLGNSFWSVGPVNDPGRFAKTDAMPDFSDGRPYLLWLEARITNDDGVTQVVRTDESWRWTDGPLTFSHIYAGEDYDATRAPAGWSEPGFDDSAWHSVQVVPAPPARLEPLTSPGVRGYEVFAPREIREPEPGVYTYVFPQNCSALLRFRVEGQAGETVRFKPCEYMDVTGRVRFTYTWGTGKDIWQDYTLRGGGIESHMTKFCYVGCQYVEVTGAVPEGRPNPDGLPVLHSLELLHVRAANPAAGDFACSSELQNGAHRLIDWSIRSNMSHVATDCPHREKNGWQEQNWHMARALSYRYDVQDWYRKIAHDLRDTQLPDGHVPTNCPNYLVGVPPHGFWNEAPEWGIAAVLVPWHLYEWYGDRQALADAFESMKRYVDYLASQQNDGVIRSNLGDWYDYGHGKGDGPSRWTPTEVSATAIWALGSRTVADAAAVLGRTEDEARYRAMFEQVRGSFVRHFYDADTRTVRHNGSCQAAHATALCIGLVPEEDRPAVLAAIVADLEQRGYQQTTGEVLQVFLIRALAEAGLGDVLHRVFAREERGGYGYMVNSGLTTLPESWDAKPGTGNSMNHFMLGHLMEWHFAYVAGIRQAPGSVGWRRVLIAPQPGPLTSAEATFDSPAGRITSRWKHEAGAFELTVEIPEGVEAEAVLPDGTRQALPGGLSTLRCPLD